MGIAGCQFFGKFNSRTHLFLCSKCFPQRQFSDLTAHSLSSSLPQNHLPLCLGLEWVGQLEKLTVVVMAEMLMHIVEEQVVHIMGGFGFHERLG